MDVCGSTARRVATTLAMSALTCLHGYKSNYTVHVECTCVCVYMLWVYMCICSHVHKCVYVVMYIHNMCTFVMCSMFNWGHVACDEK